MHTMLIKWTFEISATDYIEEKNKVQLNLQSKLVLENGLVSLPDPSELMYRWFAAPYNFPNMWHCAVNEKAQCETQSRYQWG